MKTATVVQLKNIREHPNADRVNLVTVFGNQVVIGKDVKEGDLGLFFEIETELDRTFCKENNLFDDATLNKDGIKGYFSSKTPRVKVQNFRGAKSEGFWMPLSCLDYTGKNDLKSGVEFQEINGHKICWKWINEETKISTGGGKELSSVVFKRHINTKKFGKFAETQKIPFGTRYIVTEKLHGCSSRVGNVIQEITPKWYQFWKRKTKEYSFIVGSRTVIKSVDGKVNDLIAYYNEDIWTESAKIFKGILHKGETIYYEIVGYLSDGTPIMDSSGQTEFHYNNDKGVFSIYVYRITMTNEDGIDYDLSWQQIKTRCSRLGLNYVPELEISFVKDVDSFIKRIKVLSESPSSIFTGHIKEGVCVRIENGERNPIILKEKNFQFKVLENIIKESGVVNTEESN